MDSFQELFAGGENWTTGDGREFVRQDNISSADSTTPPPQHIDEKDDRKSANSIRGKIYNVYNSKNKMKTDKGFKNL